MAELKHHLVLIAEDEVVDALLIKKAFAMAGLTHQLFPVYDGQYVIDYLSGTGAYANRRQFPIPGLILLDLKMPRVGGFAVLEWLRSRPEFRSIPVVILSASGLECDRQRARDLGAVDYLVKPGDIYELSCMVSELSQRWLGDSKDKDELVS